MTSDPIEIIRGALEDSADQDDEGSMWLTEADFTGAADRIARALADAGLLTPTNATTRTEWGVADVPDHPDEIWALESEDRARTRAQHLDMPLYRRSVVEYTGPWQPASPPTDTTQET